MSLWSLSGEVEHLAEGVFAHTTTRAEGNFALDAEPVGLAARRRRVVDLPWAWVRQVHGAEVRMVTSDDVSDVAGSEGDALVTAEPGLVLAIQTADCAPIVFWSPEGVIGAAHAGWRGLEAGVVERTLTAMTDLGAGRISAGVGPHIGVGCYEFGPADLARLTARFGDRVSGVTRGGRPALDLAELVRVALGEPRGDQPDGRAVTVTVDGAGAGDGDWCTACGADRWFSHRARGEPERMATVIWRRSPVVTT
jgi:copper oxidase (laccase) domain-containing protein